MWLDVIRESSQEIVQANRIGIKGAAWLQEQLSAVNGDVSRAGGLSQCSYYTCKDRFTFLKQNHIIEREGGRLRLRRRVWLSGDFYRGNRERNDPAPLKRRRFRGNARASLASFMHKPLPPPRCTFAHVAVQTWYCDGARREERGWKRIVRVRYKLVGLAAAKT